MTLGTPVTHTLILHPMRSAWLLYDLLDEDKVDRLSENLLRLSKQLLAWQCDFDYGDEGLLEKYGSVEQGSLCVGQQKYDTVILCDTMNIEPATLVLCKRFAEQGGKLIVIGQKPEFIAGMADNSFQKQVAGLNIVPYSYRSVGGRKPF